MGWEVKIILTKGSVDDEIHVQNCSDNVHVRGAFGKFE